MINNKYIIINALNIKIIYEHIFESKISWSPRPKSIRYVKYLIALSGKSWKFQVSGKNAKNDAI